MTDEEAKLLNTFFSNFSEVPLDYNFGCPGVDEDRYMIIFGVEHAYLNGVSTLIRVDAPNYKSFVPAETVDAAAMRYFGRRIKRHRSIMSGGRGYDYHFNNGKYYRSSGDGDPFYWSSVRHFYDNGDGTFTGVVEDYASHCLYSDDNVYARRKYWRFGNCDPVPNPMSGGDGYMVSGNWTATVAPHVYNGKRTYKMISMGCK
jgi:hypothetical protein